MRLIRGKPEAQSSDERASTGKQQKQRRGNVCFGFSVLCMNKREFQSFVFPIRVTEFSNATFDYFSPDVAKGLVTTVNVCY